LIVRPLARITAAAILSLVAAVSVQADPIAATDLEIRGSGLTVVDLAITAGINLPSTLQTEFGGKRGDAVTGASGLSAVGELTGPGLTHPIELHTVPGSAFQIPGLPQQGVYLFRGPPRQAW
jgi:hypothetical protein